ncbi:hypothetical protein [Varunaivibrio sulfuroxidans]|uniref:Uncharacterized protein n=1 Tax=Varunaivibrio sulfuroxidans TaxID=1773489 RepID=A0A4R3JC88_9PROT|nr:hypothetical protein [Varunaivibrio sulfuroxidans]TCS63578.1 hypothetical protein EDD55_103201 [Varunaivibrio sulfuroxidans]WES30279.1 hypothetical protein P3M64_11640 [Varunaivibrio sulfuroxidans]
MARTYTANLLKIAFLVPLLGVIPLKMNAGGASLFSSNIAMAEDQGNGNKTEDGQNGMMDSQSDCVQGQPCSDSNGDAKETDMPKMDQGMGQDMEQDNEMEHKNGGMNGDGGTPED